MPTINKRFLARLLLGFLLVAGSLAGLHAIQSRRIPDALKRQADRSVAAGKSDAAVSHLRRYLEFRPADADAMEQLAGLLRERSGDTGRSDLQFLYDRILRTDPNRPATRREAVKLCLQYGRFADAATHANALLQLTPTDAEVWQLLAAAQTGQREFNAAATSYERAVSAAPANLLAYQRLAQLHSREQKQPTAAVAVLDRMVAANAKDANAYIARARMSAADAPANVPLAEDPILRDLAKAAELKPNHPDIVPLKVERFQKRRESAAALACLTDAVRRDPSDTRLVRQLAWFELSRGNTPAAIAALEQGLARDGQVFDLLVPLSDILLQLGDTARAEEALRKLERRNGAEFKLQATYLTARIAMSRGKWDDAIRLLTELRTRSAALPPVEMQANLLLAECHRHTADPAAERESLQLVVAKDATNVVARVGLGQLALADGRSAEAINEYEAAARSPTADAAIWHTLARLKIAQVRMNPASAADVERFLAEIAPRFAADPFLHIQLRAELATASGNTKRSAEILRDEALRRPGDGRVWSAFALSAADADGVTAGMSVLDRVQQAGADGPDLRLARATLAARDPARLRPLRPLEEDTDRWPDGDQLRLLAGLVEVYDRLGDEGNVVRIYRRIAGRRVNDLPVWEAVYRRAIRANDPQSATVARAAITRLTVTDSPTVKVCDAWDRIAAGNPDPAVLASFGPRFDRPDVLLALAAMTTDRKQAGDYLRRATRLAPTQFEPMREWVAHLAGEPNAEPLTQTLATLAADPKWAGEPFQRVVRSAAMTRPVVAERLLATVKPFVASQPGGLGWLAECHAAMKQTDAARTVAASAARQPFATADDWLRSALLSGPNELAAAREKLSPTSFAAIAAVFTSTPAGATWTPTLADAVSKRTFAEVKLANNLARFDRTAGIVVLDEFVSTNPPAADLRWAKSQLARLLVVRGEPADRRRAIDLFSNFGPDIEDCRIAATTLATLARSLDGDDRVTAISRSVAAFEQLAKFGTPDDRFAVVLAYRSARQQRKFRDGLNALLAADPQNLDYLLAGFDEHLAANAVELAAPFADRLDALHKTDFRAVVALARYDVARGKPDAALARLEAFGKDGDVSVTTRVAETLAALARSPGVANSPACQSFTDAAVARFEAVAAGRADVVVTAAGLFGASGRIDEAFAKIDRLDRVLTPATKLAAGLAAVRGSGASEKQFARVRHWLDAARQDDPDGITVRLSEAELLALRHDYAAAEAIYIAVLKDNPRNVHALNNLAWLVAPKPEASERALGYIARAVREAGVTPELLDTRARVRIAAKQFTLAEADLAEALRAGPTPLRLFHDALAKQGQQPPRPEEAARSFREAQRRGLTPTTVHPDDLPQYRSLNSAAESGR